MKSTREREDMRRDDVPEADGRARSLLRTHLERTSDDDARRQVTLKEWVRIVGTKAGIVALLAVLASGPEYCGFTRPTAPFISDDYELIGDGRMVTERATDEVLRISFDEFEPGPLSAGALRGHVESVTAAMIPERTQIIAISPFDRALAAHFPAGAVGPQQGGATFIVALPQAVSYRLGYRVRASQGFDFARGGKLPGLCSGGGRYSGGVIPLEGDGWSARYTWGATGSLSVYLYHVGMTGPWGAGISTQGRLMPGQWHRVEQSVQVNRPGSVDGRIRTWVDGVLVQDRSGIELRRGDQGTIDSICFSNFHGGSGPEFAPSVPSVMTFDDVEVRIDREVAFRDGGASGALSPP